MTRTALAGKAGVSDAIVRYLETDQRLPTVETVARIARALDLSAAWLAYGLGEPGVDAGEPTGSGMGERLGTARNDCGHTRIELARLAELNPGTIAKIENGGQAGIDTIEQLATALGVSPAWLAYGLGPRELPKRRRSDRTARAAQ